MIFDDLQVIDISALHTRRVKPARAQIKFTGVAVGNNMDGVDFTLLL